MPPRRLRNPQATQHNPRFRHDAPSPGRAGLRPAVYPLHERPRARSTARAASRFTGTRRSVVRSVRRGRSQARTFLSSARVVGDDDGDRQRDARPASTSLGSQR
jgi:hypothetical protein